MAGQSALPANHYILEVRSRRGTSPRPTFPPPHSPFRGAGCLPKAAEHAGLGTSPSARCSAMEVDAGLSNAGFSRGIGSWIPVVTGMTNGRPARYENWGAG